MELELTIQQMFDESPTLFKERSDCLDHLFCCIGNGYEWENGELVYMYKADISEQALRDRIIAGKAHQYNKLSLRAEAIYYYEKRQREGKEPSNMDYFAMKYFDKLPDDVYHKLPRSKRWSFWLGGYSTRFAYLFNYPADIKPDWLAGIEECKTMLRADGYDIDHPDENPIDRMANLEEYRNLLRTHPWF